jgi:glycosyltransferase involved in cell wall biosynthesis
MPDALLIEPCDFEGFPPGGQLTFAKQLLSVFRDKLALVGFSTDDTPVGKWLEKSVNGFKYLFFSIGTRVPTPKKPFVPMRVTSYCQLQHFRKRILSLGVRCVFVQAQEVIMAVRNWGWESICYRFPGTENPLTISRYKWAQPLSRIFENVFISSVRRADVRLAAADRVAIEKLVARSKGILSTKDIIQFPTRVDTAVFRPMSQVESRRILGVPEYSKVIVTTGRIHWAKGWDLLIEAFNLFRENEANAVLYFVGDGEDRKRLDRKIHASKLQDRIRVVGNQPPQRVATFLNAADLYALASYAEGWSTAIVEALSCGKPIVSTHVSSASDLIAEGMNGYIVRDRDPSKFARAMHEALHLKTFRQISLAKATPYALENLAKDLARVWPPLGVRAGK